ncbi:MAG: SCP2 sterol-binding domain-containing protein [Candidatus Thiodiazotropha sp. (ex Lucinoma kastoroae)]|nr:SCP2 sterol-binding domain-containing protein [Candidatus Thiodiazotropha sp. (ex Rostrolucina anterorostrata)]MCU7849680.1 SCP2 sterol-binding domain-containing protein [Candidatus Thiodiazotropha sp. (ex Lucinoma kastoroae)]MCU7861243.1 SCP2 sterol-binding domain-containing protein [Candidatus Thiodiazotropha sp. (ex Lucinoma kastoroae)]
MTISAAVFATLEQLLNQTIRLDPASPKQLAPMHGRVIKMELLGLATSLYLIPEPNGIQLLSEFEGEPDCTLRGSPFDLARMRGNHQSADQLFSGSVQIEGDITLAHKFGAFLSALDIDWEEQLSKVTGDLVAHEVGNLVRGTMAWGQSLGHTSEHNLQEYLQEELRLLPGRYEMGPYLSGVDRLRDDVERLDARIQRLKQQLADKDKGS